MGGHHGRQAQEEGHLGRAASDANPAKKEPGNYLAIDCEMVGVGEKGCESVLARVSIVNFHGATIMDRFVRPQEKVTDYRTWVSGVRPKDLKNAPSFSEVQGEVANLIKGKVLVGHAIQNDLKALLLSHPKPLVRDTATFQPLRDLAKTKYPSLKKLAKLVLGIDIQLEGDSHSSVEDARATMAIFRSQKSKWDESLRTKGPVAAVEVLSLGWLLVQVEETRCGSLQQTVKPWMLLLQRSTRGACRPLRPVVLSTTRFD